MAIITRFLSIFLLVGTLALVQKTAVGQGFISIRSAKANGEVSTATLIHRALTWDNNFYKTEEQKQQQEEEEQREYEEQMEQEEQKYEEYVENKMEKAEQGQTNTDNQEFYGYDESDGYGYSGVESGVTWPTGSSGSGSGTTQSDASIVSQAQGAKRSSEQKLMLASGTLLVVGSLFAVGMYVYARRKATAPKQPVEKTNFNLMEEAKVDIA